ncbi:MAG: DUF1232 domain-containing protein [Candidatus Thermoplasmatota archaeon]|nr:DUF1232 domain-containing protein [Candidatus Thermoplasmatota archaeon]
MKLPIVGEIKGNKIIAILFALFTMIYVASPVDFIPDIIPVIGWIDDLLAIGISIYLLFSGDEK